MHSICLALVAFFSLIFSPPLHASQSKLRVIALDKASARSLRQKVRLSLREQVSQAAKKRGGAKARAGKSRGGGSPPRDQVFYGFDGTHTYPLKLPANSDQLQIVGDAVAQAPGGQIVVNLTEMKSVYDMFSEYLTETYAARATTGRGRSPKTTGAHRRRSKSRSHSPDPARASTPAHSRSPSPSPSPSPSRSPSRLSESEPLSVVAPNLLNVGDDVLDTVVIHLPLSTAVRLSEVNRALYGWSKNSPTALPGQRNTNRVRGAGYRTAPVAEAGGLESGEASASAVAGLVADNSAVSEQTVYDLLRSQRKLSQVFAMEAEALDSFGEMLEGTFSKGLLLHRSRLGSRLDALKQYVKAQREYLEALNSIESEGVKKFVAAPSSVEVVPAEVITPKFLKRQKRIAEAKVKAIEALEKDGVIVPYGPQAKADRIYWESLSPGGRNHSEVRRQIILEKDYLAAEYKAHVLKVKRAPVSELVKVAGDKAYYAVRLKNKSHEEASLARAAVVELLSSRGSVSDLAEAAGEKAYYTAMVANKSDAEAQLAKAVARLDVLSFRGGSVSEVAKAAGLKAYYTALLANKSVKEASLTGAVARLEVFSSKGGPVSEVAKAAGLKAYYTALLANKSVKEASLTGAVARLEVFSSKGSPPALELAEAAGDKAYYAALLANRSYVEAELAKAVARLEVFSSRGGSASEVAEAVGDKAYYAALLANRSYVEAELAKAVARFEVLISKGGSASEIADAEKKLYLAQSFIP